MWRRRPREDFFQKPGGRADFQLDIHNMFVVESTHFNGEEFICFQG